MKIGGTDLVGKYNGVFGSRFLVQGMVARHEETDKFSGAGRDIPQLHRSDGDAERDAAAGSDSSRIRTSTATSSRPTSRATWAATTSRSAVDYEHIKAVNNNYNGGAGQRIYKLSTQPAAQGPSTTATAST